MASGAPISGVQQILVTDELAKRPSRRPRFAEENRALAALIRTMAASPEQVPATVADIALRLCKAGSTGISLVEDTKTEGPIFRWVALSGAYADLVGGHAPRNFSPCGVCLQYGAPVLLSYPARLFTYFDGVQPPIVEGLVVPISYSSEDIGTVWIVSHDDGRKFDREDVRIMSNLANATAVVLHARRPGTQ